MRIRIVSLAALLAIGLFAAGCPDPVVDSDADGDTTSMDTGPTPDTDEDTSTSPDTETADARDSTGDTTEDTAGGDGSETGVDTTVPDTSGDAGADAADSGTPGDADGGDAGCVPRTCSQAGAACGTISDGCGGTVDCGGCNKHPASTCNNNQCSCTPKSCGQIAGACGVHGDGCGGTVTCSSGCTDVLATGGYHTCFLDASTNQVKCWGWNKYGQIGTGSASTKQFTNPQTVSTSFGTPTEVTAGEDMTCVIDGGQAKCWGANYHGQAIGVQKNSSGNTINKVLTPQSPQVPGSGLQKIETHVQHTCGVTAKKKLYCWGFNWPVTNGVLLSSKTKEAVKPRQYTFGSTATVERVDAGALHTCAETTKGELWCFGNDFFGALGDGGTQKLQYHPPRKVKGFTNGFLQVESGGMDTNKGGSSASFTHDFSCAIDYNAAAKCWGSDWDGELGNGANKNTRTGNAAETAPVQVKGLAADVQDLALGGSHACAVKLGGLQCWGGNGYGQLGDGTTKNRNTPVNITMPNNEQVISVEAGYFHTCARLKGGKVACWGRNNNGQLGDGTTQNRKTPKIVIP